MNVLPKNTTCSKCSSPDTQRVAMAYSSGTSCGHVSAVTYSGGDNFGVVGGNTTVQTLLAQQLRPPEEPPFVVFLLTAVVGSIVAAVVIFFAVALTTGTDMYGYLASGVGGAVTFGFGLWRLDKSYNKIAAQYKKDTWRWNNSWICLRCGNTWLPRATDSVRLAA